VTPAALLLYAGPPTVALCAASYFQRRAWRRPARTPAEERRRNAWSVMFPLSQFGVRVGADLFVYANGTGRCLGHSGGAKATIEPSIPVGKVKPRTGLAVITFADGTSHRRRFGLRLLPEAKAQAARFNGIGQATQPATFRRTRPAKLP
jgi:hypothetical protein